MSQAPRNILIIRFSSIGDIVLTTPVIRSLKEALPNCQIHFLTKAPYADLLRYNPHISQLHLLGKDWASTMQGLKEANIDAILDLHGNLRSLRVKAALRVSSSTFDKKNWAKYWMVRTAGYPDKPLPHIVQRYGDTLHKLGLTLDDKGLEIHYPASLDDWATRQLASINQQQDCLAVVLGAKFATKRWLPAYFLETLHRLQRPVLLIGGSDAIEERDFLMASLSVPVFDAVNKFSLLESAALLNQTQEVLTHDTGFMHIAAALGKKTYSLWGNTVPALGMTPYRTESVILENKTLDCRPCSKIGFDKCPKGHFRCMTDLTPEIVLKSIRGNEGMGE
ncbi:MAG: glycosyltransferase family 9 protein [Bacteroidia bacterium]|nr:glycosyltransferase family 9 protein [Bacteroidia bacterium]